MPALDERTHSLVEVAVAVASGDEARLRARLESALGRGVPARWVDELLLQGMLNVGYALALQAFAVWRELNPVSEPGEPLAPAEPERWRSRGAEVCAAVYGRTYHKLLVNLRALHPALEALVVVDAYGKLIGREGLDLRRRELCTLAEIAVLNTPRQLHAHLRGALNTGALAREIDAVLDLVEAGVGPERARLARQLWADVRARARPASEPDATRDG